jgi:hypothetical protein
MDNMMDKTQDKQLDVEAEVNFAAQPVKMMPWRKIPGIIFGRRRGPDHGRNDGMVRGEPQAV